MPTTLVTDSTSYLPFELTQAHGIRVVPLHVVVGGQQGQEGVDLSAADVAAALRKGQSVSTSRPTPEAFAEAYLAAAEAGATEIVSVHLSADLSSTVGSAHLAARTAPVPVTVLDSRTLGMAMGYAVVAGARAAESGATAEEIARLVRSRCDAASVLFYVDTLEHLRRGGRIGKAGALVGSALAIKPLLSVVDGQIVLQEKVRTASRALSRLEELSETAVAAAPQGVEIAVHHLDSRDRAEALADRLRSAAQTQRTVRVVELGAVVGAHVGPGTLAVAICPLPESA